MKCPSCNAKVAATASVCHDCGQKLADATPKRTMMGLPSVDRDSNEPVGDEPTKQLDRNTLFGIPAASKEEGLSEGTLPSAVAEHAQTAADPATQVVSDRDLEAVKGAQDHDQRNTGERGTHSTAFGLPSPTSHSADEDQASDQEQDFASAWGLAEESSEGEGGATQVAGAALADAIFESKSGAGGFSKTKSDDVKPMHGTLMGMSRDEIDEESTLKVDQDKLEQVRAMHSAAEEAKRARRAHEAQAAEPEPEYPFEEDDDATQALGADELAKFEERIQTDRREQLLEKLRSKSKPTQDDTPRDTARGIPSAPAEQQPQQDAGQQPAGPRFSIPSPGKKKAPAAKSASPEPEEISVEPVEALQPERNPGFGGGKTSFPISSGASESSETTHPARHDLSDDELDLALGDTGVISGQATARALSDDNGAGLYEFVDDDSLPTQDSGIQEYTESSEADRQPIFPIDQRHGEEGGQEFDLSDDLEPSHPTVDGFGETPASGTQVPAGPVSQQPQLSQQPQQDFEHGHEHAQSSPAEPRQSQQGFSQQAMPSNHPAAQSIHPTAQPADPTEKLVETVQMIFGVLGALFLLGAGGYGVSAASAGNLGGQMATGAPALIGLLTLVLAFLPLSRGVKNGGFFAMTVCAAGALAAGVAFSAPMAVLLLSLGGLLLVLCAGAFPLVLKVVQ